MKYINLLLTLSLLSSCSSLNKDKSRGPASFDGITEKVEAIRGMPSIDLELVDVWTSGLSVGEEKKKLPHDNKKRILESYYYANSVEEFFNKLLILDLHHTYPTMNSYKQLAEQLFAVRKELRSRSIENDHYLRQSLMLLELLGEEVLYAGKLRFPDQNNISFTYNNPTLPCMGRVGKLNGVTVCQGDVLLSKGGAGSSNFIAKITDYPGNFSHAAIVYVDAATKGVYLPESFIEDGVKLRSPKDEYENSSKAKLFIYRSKSSVTIGQAIQGVDQFVSMMIDRIGSNSYQDLAVKAALPYDFSMNGSDPSALACTEVVLQSYMMGGATQTNPYPQELWSTANSSGQGSLVTDFLKIAPQFPAPSDLELNPRYDLISLSFNLNKLGIDRQMIAMIDILIEKVEESDAKIKKLSEYLKDYDRPYSKEELIEKIVRLDRALGSNFATSINDQIPTIPSGMKLSQVLFFGILDHYLVPKTMEMSTRFNTAQLLKYQYVSLKKLRTFSRLSLNQMMDELLQKLEI